MPNSPRLIEVSWEVANKVGGIYTVMTSKLGQVREAFAEHYLAIGPYLGPNSLFQESKAPAHWQAVIDMARDRGVIAHYGTWQIPEEPETVLIEWSGLLGKNNDIKARFWEIYQLDTMGSNFFDVDEPLLWSTGVGIFVQCLIEQDPTPTILQVHEWMSAGAILQTGKDKPAHLHTVFTTHATVLGRALSSEGRAIYDQLATIDPEQEARNHGVQSKHQLERIGAQTADIFTTVSHLTAEEATVFLGRQAEVTENGLNIAQFPTLSELINTRLGNRQLLLDFLAAYFFPSYRFDLTRSQLYCTMGRYEIHNKGYDLFVDALGKLNNSLKEKGSQHSIISFFLVPGDSIGLASESHALLTGYQYVQRRMAELLNHKRTELYKEALNDTNGLPQFSESLKRQLLQLSKHLPTYKQVPPSPYNLRQGNGDGLMRLFQEHGLLNSEEDRVKVIFLPVYLDGFDGIFNTPLYELITAFDLGVFPSFYEPWGYTPMECLALGVPTVTSTLAGFGRSLSELRKSFPQGVHLINRRQSSDEQSSEHLVHILEQQLKRSHRNQEEQRISAYTVAQDYDWSKLFVQYQKLYDALLKK